MVLLKRFLKSELREMLDNGIRFQAIGRLHKLPNDVQKTLRETAERTASNRNMVLTLALSYGGRQEMTDAVRKMVQRVEAGEIRASDISEALLSEHLYTANMPDPDLLIRTSGECRVSNFLLWQIAYAEIYMTPTYWPDFRKEEYVEALIEYQKRERRFGATGDQVALSREGTMITRLLKNAHLRRYPHSSSLRRTSMYASLLGISDALHLSVFDQPAKQVFCSTAPRRQRESIR